MINSSPRDHKCAWPARLTSCARMPSHFHSTCQSGSIAEQSADLLQPRRAVDRRGQAKRVGPRKIGVGRPRINQAAEPAGRRRPLAHQPRRHRRRCNRRRFGQRANDQRLRHAKPQLAGQHLQQGEALPSRQRLHPAKHGAPLAVEIHLTQRHDALLDPFGEAHGFACQWRQLIEQQRGGLGAVPDDGVAFGEEPFGQAGRRQRPFGNRPAGRGAFQSAAGQEEHRPRRIGRGRAAEVVDHRLDFEVGRRGVIEGGKQRGETLHERFTLCAFCAFCGSFCAFCGFIRSRPRRSRVPTRFASRLPRHPARAEISRAARRAHAWR